jgi:activator of 2-hydroxyglutaryl-CoA dehydratase
MKRVYVGLDLGSSQFEYVALDHEGVILARRLYNTSAENLRAAFSLLRDEQKCEIYVDLEAGELAGWAREVIAQQVTRVLSVIHGAISGLPKTRVKQIGSMILSSQT